MDIGGGLMAECGARRLGPIYNVSDANRKSTLYVSNYRNKYIFYINLICRIRTLDKGGQVDTIYTDFVRHLTDSPICVVQWVCIKQSFCNIRNPSGLKPWAYIISNIH